MKCDVYKALDRPISFFGVKGGFIGVFFTFCFFALAIGVIVGSIVGASWVGFLTFGGGVVLSYFIVCSLQDKGSDRQFFKRLQSHRFPKFIKIAPLAFERRLKGGKTKE